METSHTLNPHLCPPPVSPTDLQSNEERYCLHRIVPSIHVVSHEQIICVRGIAANTEQLHEVVELSMDITAHSHRTLDLLYIRFLGQDLLCLGEEGEGSHSGAQQHN